MQQLECQYANLLQAFKGDGVWDLCSALQSIRHAHLMPCQDRGNHPLYAAYIDDIMLVQVRMQSAKTDLCNPLATTFVGEMQADCAWLAVLFCSSL
jgi:hypothetical protein